ncbi:tolB protein precursor, periplasmic protein involved in the tonb-independent uptake of group A colicins [hydrothermal vent metagenome]|uniref:TolB protein, periplasmic protein involved in the tonb-independent uptake of group A colicins n=1 Tax=hydrothermal vent metagenome TaxID=652676 RepID=A0A3B0V6G0_9ZZZZ
MTLQATMTSHRGVRILSALLVMLMALALAAPARAKVYIDIDSPGGKLLPIAIQKIAGLEIPGSGVKPISSAARADAATYKLKRSIMDALMGDIKFSGFFEILDKNAYIEDISDSGLTRDETDFSLWRIIDAELLIKGGIRLDGEKLTAEFRLFDTGRGTTLLAKRYVGSKNSPRLLAHRFADDLIKKLTGKKGIYSTKIAFISNVGGSKEVYMADYDGKNIKQVTSNGSINISPRWSPDRRKLLYTSYMTGYPCIFEQELITGRVSVISDKEGSNIGGRWSPDGTRIAYTATGRKSPEIYIRNSSSGKLTQLTNNYSIDVSPVWSPDGKRIAFVSDRAGNPHIYMIKSTGGKVRRITYKGKYNTDPDWSPDGKTIAFTRFDKTGTNVWTIRPDGTGLKQLTFEGNNQSPSWSPDGRYLVFSRQWTGRVKRLYIMRKDGSGMERIKIKIGKTSAPSWSPYRR